MTDRPTLTAAIITLNEERNLPGLLERLDWVDEIVVVDSGSRDDTVAIARRRAGCVVVRPFGNFADQRNHAIRLATGDWVLSIDADERPTDALVEELRERIANGRFTAFRVPIRSSIFGRRMRYSGTQGDHPIRLFRRDCADWTGDVHEVLRVAGRIGRLRHWLTHTTLPDLTAFMRKVHRYTDLAARDRVAAGRAPRSRDLWLRPAIEIFRRLAWKHGYLDGPEGWAFCALSGLSEWILESKHQRLWNAMRMRSAECEVRSVASTGLALHHSAFRTPHSALPIPG